MVSTTYCAISYEKMYVTGPSIKPQNSLYTSVQRSLKEREGREHSPHFYEQGHELLLMGTDVLRKEICYHLQTLQKIILT